MKVQTKKVAVLAAALTLSLMASATGHAQPAGDPVNYTDPQAVAQLPASLPTRGTVPRVMG